MSPERKLFLDRLAVRNYSTKTIRSYEQALLKLATFHNKSPIKMDRYEIEAFLLHELKVEKLAPATVNLHIGAFKTFYKLVMDDSRIMEDVKAVKVIHKLPTILSSAEVGALLRVTENLKHRSMIEILYSSGIRLAECANLTLSDIDKKNMLLHVEQGKGRKERYTLLSKSALETLTSYFYGYAPHHYLFEGRNHHKISPRMINMAVTQAAYRAKIGKTVTAHTLRHTFATHLVEQNVNLRVIQKLLGHSNIKTTTIYAHVSNAVISNIPNPLDILRAQEHGGMS